VEDLHARSLLLIVDKHVMASQAFQVAQQDLADRFTVRVAEHNGSEPELAQAEALHAQGPDKVDAIIAVGGGSTIDIAKAVALACRAGGQPLERFEGAAQLAFEPLPLIALPTTAGTGSEVTGSCVLTDYRTGRKISIRSPRLRPCAAILDPQFLVSVPRSVIRATGIDALTHALEAFHSTGANTVTDCLALGAIERISRSIVAYYRDPADERAGADMHIGACMAGMAFNSARVGLAHAIASAIGPLTGFSHGLCVGLGLPAAMRTNLPARAPDRKKLLFHIGLAPYDDGDWQEAVLEWLGGMYRDLEFPATARDAGTPFEVDDRLIDNIVNSGRLDTNPVRMTAADLRSVLQSICG
jgi:alcohol dehydrogenase class IV